jgi:hypothetical protein
LLLLAAAAAGSSGGGDFSEGRGSKKRRTRRSETERRQWRGLPDIGYIFFRKVCFESKDIEQEFSSIIIFQ